MALSAATSCLISVVCLLVLSNYAASHPSPDPSDPVVKAKSAGPSDPVVKAKSEGPSDPVVKAKSAAKPPSDASAASIPGKVVIGTIDLSIKYVESDAALVKLLPKRIVQTKEAIALNEKGEISADTLKGRIGELLSTKLGLGLSSKGISANIVVSEVKLRHWHPHHKPAPLAKYRVHVKVNKK